MSSSSGDSSYEEVDFEVYRKVFESEEHWKLRKAFMEKHWDKFSEDQILCLAQVFVNMEFLGCKYPAETMTQVALLAQEVPEIVRYRISRRNRLKRTFVGAQDAVQAKLKKSDAPRKLGNNSTPMEGLEDWSTSERAQFKMTLDKTQKLDNLRGLLRDVINFEVSDNPSAGLSKTIANMQKIGKLEMNYEADEKKFLYVFNGQIIGEGSGATKKEAKKKADEDFVSNLKINCYTIKHKLAFYTAEDIVTPTTSDDAPKDSTKLKEDNLGFKMLKMLGWTGGSLGSKGEGIVDPVSCEIKIGRGGLGSEQLDPKHIRELLRNFKNSQVEYDLVFSSDFTKEERAQIHMIAQQLNLRTKSYGKNDSRHIVISSKFSPIVLRQKLLEGDDPHLLEKYEIIAPPPLPKTKVKKTKWN